MSEKVSVQHKKNKSHCRRTFKSAFKMVKLKYLNAQRQKPIQKDTKDFNPETQNPYGINTTPPRLKDSPKSNPQQKKFDFRQRKTKTDPRQRGLNFKQMSRTQLMNKSTSKSRVNKQPLTPQSYAQNSPYRTERQQRGSYSLKRLSQTLEMYKKLYEGSLKKVTSMEKKAKENQSKFSRTLEIYTKKIQILHRNLQQNYEETNL